MNYAKWLYNEDSNVHRMLTPSSDELVGLSSSITKLRGDLRNDPGNATIHFQLGVALVSHSRLSFVNEGVNILERIILISLDDKFAGSPTPLADKTRSFDKRDPSYGDVQSYQINGSAHSTSAASSLDHEGAPTHNTTNTVTYDPSVVSASSASSLHKTSSGRSDEQNSRNNVVDNTSLYYYLAIGNIKLGRHDRAVHCLDQILRTNPNHQQVIAVKKYIEHKIKRDKAVDVATVTGAGVAIAGAAALCAMMFSRRK